MNLHTVGRGPSKPHMMVRLAIEGIPIAAIARALQEPFREVLDVLKEARAADEIAEIPAHDWPAGQRRGERAPCVAKITSARVGELLDALMTAFRLTQNEGIFLDLLVARGTVGRPAIHEAMMRREGAAMTVPKIVDVYACSLRKKLGRHGITFETVWGRGYTLPAAGRNAILRAIAANREEFEEAAELHDEQLELAEAA